eukprot:Opistho-1_new@37504
MANLAFVVGVCLAFVASASASLGPYNVDTTKISVSGLSAGGFMAVQFHVAYSASIMGSAVFAGGPYFCAQGSVITAQTTCMAVPLALNVDPLISKVKGLSNADIDDPSNLRRAKVFTYSGTKDSVVNPGVVKKLNDFYAAFVDASNMATELTIASQHCIPTSTMARLALRSAAHTSASVTTMAQALLSSTSTAISPHPSLPLPAISSPSRKATSPRRAAWTRTAMSTCPRRASRTRRAVSTSRSTAASRATRLSAWITLRMPVTTDGPRRTTSSCYTRKCFRRPCWAATPRDASTGGATRTLSTPTRVVRR